MANNKNLESIDEIFRKTFSELPETPAANGWDAPSDHVWQQVQTGIQTRHNTWSNTAKIMGLMSISVVVAAGIYFLTLSDPSETSTPVAAAPLATTPVTTPAPKAAPMSVTTDKPERKKVVADVAPKVILNTTVVDTKITDQPIKNTVLKPILAPDQAAEKAVVPNVVERRKQVERIKSTWGKLLHTIPAQRKATPIPAVPSELKHLVPNIE